MKKYWHLIEPIELTQDTSDYLDSEPCLLLPGVCLASATFTDSSLLTDTDQSTTASIMLQRGTERVISVANHGFEPSAEVYDCKSKTKNRPYF